MVYLYDGGIYGIKGNDHQNVLEQDTGIFPGSHENVKVFNIGRYPIYCILRYGTKVQWIGNITSTVVAPGETGVLKNGGRPYYVTGLKLQNDTKNRVIACAHYASGGGGYAAGGFEFDLNINNVLRQLVSAGVKFVPYVGAGLSFLVLTFWPEQKKSVWEQVKDDVKQLVDTKIQEAINGLLDGDITQYKVRINTVIKEVETKKEAAVHYMNIAQDLIGFENKFIFPESHPDHKKINYCLLPLYSHVIHMKLLYYLIGIDQASKIGLSADNLNDIKNYADTLLNDKDTGAVAYIKKVYKEQVDTSYDTVDPRGIFNGMMSVRSYISVNGLEYLPIWDYILKNPSAKDPKIYNDAISYSMYHGRQTSNLARVAVPEDQEEPLTPKLIDGKRNKIKNVVLYIWRINSGTGSPKIGGMKVTFQNGSEYMMGEFNSENHTVEFKDARLNKMTIWGLGALDMITFNFSDGREVSHGSNDNSRGETSVFEMEKHHIVGMFLANDFKSTARQANNIAVSYQLTVE